MGHFDDDSKALINNRFVHLCAKLSDDKDANCHSQTTFILIRRKEEEKYEKSLFEFANTITTNCGISTK